MVAKSAKRQLTPRIVRHPGPRERQNAREEIWRQQNREVVKVARMMGIPIAEARTMLAAGAAARPAPVAHNRPTQRTHHDGR